MRLADIGLSLKDVNLGAPDAESDYDLENYFVTTPHVEAMFQGRRVLFLGRKGSGKSALFTQLGRLALVRGLDDIQIVQLTPDSYAWSALKDYREQGIPIESAHTNAWKVTIAIELASRLVALGRTWTPSTQVAVDSLGKFLKDNFGRTNPGLVASTAAVLKGLSSFNLSALGFGVGASFGASDKQPMTPAVIARILELVGSVTDECGSIVAFDRLDDSWTGDSESRSLMVGLLKAAKELNDEYGSNEITDSLRVIVFLRSDIYENLQFDDKDKHRSTEEHINWNADELKHMLELRLPETVTVDELFEEGEMRGSTKPFSYIARRTFLRPREILQFVEESARRAGPDATVIAKEDVQTAEVRYSLWKVEDLKQEFSKVFPDFDPLLECLRQGVSRYDAILDLQVEIEAKDPSLTKKYAVRGLMEELFDASVIGIRISQSGSARFRCEDSDLKLPNSGAVYVHPSLHRGLSIRETRKPKVDEQRPTVGTSLESVTIQLMSLMMSESAVQDMTYLGGKPRPIDIFRNLTFAQCVTSLLGQPPERDEDGTRTRTLERPALFYAERFAIDTRVYERLRDAMLEVLKQNRLTVANYESGQSEATEDEVRNS